MWWLFHMLHNSEGNCCCVGNGCCDRSLVIYTAALEEEWTGRLPRSPRVLPCSTQRHTQMGASDLLWLGRHAVERGGSKPPFTMSRLHKL